MDVQAVVQECTVASDEGRVAFPQIVADLTSAGVEQYHADLWRSEKTYYLSSGASYVVPAAPVTGAPATDFSAPSIAAAIRASQAQQISYKTFCERIADAGCVGYHVSLVGRRVVYFGRTGENYVEPFPAGW